MARLEADYSYHIRALRRNYQRRQSIVDNLNFKEQSWCKAINRIVAETDKQMMLVIVHVYIIRDCNLLEASKRYMFMYYKGLAKLVRQWFAKLDSYFFDEVRRIK